MSTGIKGRAATRGVLLLAAIGLAVAGCGSSSSPPASTGSNPVVSSPSSAAVQRIDVSFKGGVITPAPSKVIVPLGTHVVLTVTSDVAEEAHNHYNDKELEIPAGGSVTFDFVADNPGVYEVELHKANKQLLQLQVQ